MSLIDNHRTKLLANALDRAWTACFTVGIAAPPAGYLHNIVDIGALLSPARLGITVAGRLFASIALHMMAMGVLGKLKP